MKNKKIIQVLIILLCILFTLHHKKDSYASEEGRQMVTISIDASDDGTGPLMYAIDSADPEAFGYSNEFTILSGTSHTIYVKDAAGNITSEQYVSSDVSQGSEEDGQKIDINLKIGDSQEQQSYDYLTDSVPVEKGGGTVYDKVSTTGSSSDSKLFYTIKTKNDHVFYMVIDQSQSNDNVYLLDQVTETDLLSLVNGADATPVEKEDSLLKALTNGSSEANLDSAANSESQTDKGKKSNSNTIIMLIIIVIGGVVYYYLKVYRKKKDNEMDAMDAMDMDDFGIDDDEEHIIEFETDEEEKEAYLKTIIASEDATEESLYDVNPEEMSEEDEFSTIAQMEEGEEYEDDFDMEEDE